ncbi:MAG: hypothetical protein IJX47_06440 [Clostridia bacterium]|nr:hypothetical protein [Clostridia bacterium]MBQ8382822.1 hypothetical protein [Clostridia bacterium]
MPDTYELLEARHRFAAGQYEDALAELDKIPEAERDGDWYVFRSEIEDKLERYYDALHSLRIAIELAPKNKVYKARLKEYRKKLKAQGVPSASGKKVKSGCLPSCCGNECCTNEFCCECGGECCCSGTCECLCESIDCS